MIRKASVHWHGGSKRGVQALTMGNANRLYSDFFLMKPVKSDLEAHAAEMIALALASSFSLVLVNALPPQAAGRIVTTTTVTLEYLVIGWTVVKIHLKILARLPRMSQSRFIDATIRAKTSCLVSRLLRGNITMDAKLEE